MHDTSYEVQDFFSILFQYFYAAEKIAIDLLIHAIHLTRCAKQNTTCHINSELIRSIELEMFIVYCSVYLWSVDTVRRKKKKAKHIYTLI